MAGVSSLEMAPLSSGLSLGARRAVRAGDSLRTSTGELESTDGVEADAKLVERVRSGDLGSYRELVEKYQQRAHAIAFGIIGNHEDADDIVQDAFLKAYKSLASFRGQSSFYTWLYRIIFNLAIDLSRKRYRHVESSMGDMGSLDVALQGSSAANMSEKRLMPSAEDEYTRKQLRQQIQDAIGRLSVEHRTVILLREVDGLSYSEISDVVGCSKGTVMSRLHHARKRLQRALKDFLPAGVSAVEDSREGALPLESSDDDEVNAQGHGAKTNTAKLTNR